MRAPKWTNIAAGVMLVAFVAAAYVIMGDDQGQPRPQAAEADARSGLGGLKFESTADWSNAKTGLAAVQAMARAQVSGPAGCADKTPDYIEIRSAFEQADAAADAATRRARAAPDSDHADAAARSARREAQIAEKALAEKRKELEGQGCIWPSEATVKAAEKAQADALDRVIQTHDAMTGAKR